MTRMLRLTRLALVAGTALLSLMLALSYAGAQSGTPAAPTIDSIAPSDTQLKVAWTAPAGETGITAYDVRYIETSEDETDDTKWTVVDDAWTSGDLEYTITGLTNGTQYDVQVRAVNSNGDGTWSGTEVGTPALPAPTISSVRAGDEDYFSLTLDETTPVIIGGVGRFTDISAELLDSNNMQAPVNSIHFDDKFIFEGRLDAGTYYLKVTGKDSTETGRYTVRAIKESGQTYLVNRCSNISRSSGIDDPLYGCQWHLNNNDQFRNSSGHDIGVEDVWPTYTGHGINVAVVDDGMHYTHEDLTDNVDTSLNHNYNSGQTDIYNYFEWHGTAVAGVIAAKDNSLGVRGVAPEATIYCQGRADNRPPGRRNSGPLGSESSG